MNIVNAYLRKGRVKKNPVKYAFKDGVMSTEIFQVNNINSYNTVTFSYYHPETDTNLQPYFLDGQNIVYKQSTSIWKFDSGINIFYKDYGSGEPLGSHMFIPTYRLYGYSKIKASVKMSHIPSSLKNYYWVAVQGAAVVNGELKTAWTESALAQTSVANWVEIEENVSTLPYLDYIVLSCCGYEAMIKQIWLED